MAIFPAIDGKRFPAAFTAGLVPAPNGVVVRVKKLCDHPAGFPVIQKQDCIRSPRNAVVLALTAHADLKFAALCHAEEVGTYHKHT